MKNSKTKNRIIGIIVILLSISIFIVLRQFDLTAVKYDTEVKKWDNIYDGDNICFYYIDNKLSEIKSLNSTYEIDSVVNKDSGDLNMTMDLQKWLRGKCGVDLDVMDSNKNAGDILATLIKNSTLSQKDYNVVMQELLASVGVRTRIGEFFDKEAYSMLEVWDRELSKWIAFDVISGGYFIENGVPISSTELLKSNVKNLKLVTAADEEITLGKKEIKKLEESMGSYTVSIDNSKYEGTLFNSYVTYVKDEGQIEIETDRGYIKPTIFVKDNKVFNMDPWVNYEDDKSDEIPTIIFAKRNVENDEDKIKFAVGAFMNSVMMKEYYIRINGDQFVKIDNYYELSLEKGENVIELSLDGENSVRTVVIRRN